MEEVRGKVTVLVGTVRRGIPELDIAITSRQWMQLPPLLPRPGVFKHGAHQGKADLQIFFPLVALKFYHSSAGHPSAFLSTPGQSVLA